MTRLPLCPDVKMYVDNVENGRIRKEADPVKSVNNFSWDRKTTCYACKNQTCYPLSNRTPV